VTCAQQAPAELRKVLTALGARVLDVELRVPHAHTRFAEGGLIDEEIRAGLADAVAALAEEIRLREGVNGRRLLRIDASATVVTWLPFKRSTRKVCSR